MTSPIAGDREALLPCPFCLQSTATMYPPTCDKRAPYNPADRAFPVVRCRCGAEKCGTDWDQSGNSAIRAWNHRAALLEPVGEGWVMVPKEPTEAMLRPFYECPPDELPLAWAAMLMVVAASPKTNGGAPA